ncbi:MAG: phosphatase PAP2 family protein [Nocardioidaceae bacterium]|nr:phosphatase PAP2 family protein [Nocardioidaceae bacterium]
MDHLDRPRRLSDVATSIPVLVGGFVVVTLLAIGPLQGLDHAIDGPWAQRFAPALAPFLMNVTDRVASQPVNLPVLVIAAVLIAWRTRSPRPVLLAIGAEAGFYLTGLLKLGFARPAPVVGDPSFFAGGLWDVGRVGISFPSGHAVEVVLIYGTVVHLLRDHLGVSLQRDRVLRLLWTAAVLNCVVTSFVLGYHWLTDLLGGVVLGALLLRVLVTVDRRWPAVRREPGGERQAADAVPERVVAH